ncbi:MAG: hypothetical protein WCK86_11330 [Planctomycetia bacterium]
MMSSRSVVSGCRLPRWYAASGQAFRRFCEGLTITTGSVQAWALRDKPDDHAADAVQVHALLH